MTAIVVEGSEPAPADAGPDAHPSWSCSPIGLVSNLTVAGSVGQKQKAVESLPGYAQGRLGGNQNFINQTTALTIGPAEGTALIVLGKQPGVPIVDLHLVAH